jgi:hypothetical protein
MRYYQGDFSGMWPEQVKLYGENGNNVLTMWASIKK